MKITYQIDLLHEWDGSVQTFSFMFLDLTTEGKIVVHVSQIDNNEYPTREYLPIILPDIDPDTKEFNEYIRSEDATKFLTAIAENCHMNWAGSYPSITPNLIAREAIELLQVDIENLSQTRVVDWTCEEWFASVDITLETPGKVLWDYINNPTKGHIDVYIMDSAYDYVMDKIKTLVWDEIGMEDVSKYKIIMKEPFAATIKINDIVVPVGLDSGDKIQRIYKISIDS